MLQGVVSMAKDKAEQRPRIIPPNINDGSQVGKTEHDAFSDDARYNAFRRSSEHAHMDMDLIAEREAFVLNTEMRRTYAKGSFLAMVIWQVITMFVVISNGLGSMCGNTFSISDPVLIALVGASAVTTVVTIPLKGIFAPQGSLQNRTNARPTKTSSGDK